MSELPLPNPTDKPQPGIERFQDTDLLKEKVSHIHETVLQLAEQDMHTKYQRGYDVVLHSGSAEPYGPISIATETVGAPDNLDNSNLRIVLPPETYFRNDGGAFKWQSVLSFEKAGNEIKARVMLDPSLSPKEAFAKILERDDLPQELAVLFVDMAQSLVGTPHYDASGMNLDFPITDELYQKYWDEIKMAMDTREESVPTRLSWDTRHWHDPTINEPPATALASGETLVGASVEVTSVNGQGTIEAMELNTRNFYFFFSPDESDEPDSAEDDTNEDSEVRDENKRGTLYENNVYIFQDFTTDTLPELTPEERNRNPYMIIPAAMNIVSAPGNDSPLYVAASPDYTVTPDAAEDFGAAQRHAELLYRKQLARERSSFALTPQRAQRVIDTLDAVVAMQRERNILHPDEGQ